MLTSAQNPRIKLVQTLLGRARSRRKQGLVVLEGLRLVADAISPGAPAGVRPAYGHDHAAGRDGGHRHRPRHSCATSVIHSSPRACWPSSPCHRPNCPPARSCCSSWMAFATPVTWAPSCAPPLPPGQTGCCWRPAAWTSGTRRRCAPAWAPTFACPLAECDLAQLEQRAAQLPLILADSAGEQPYDAFDWTTPCALVIGGEARGADEPLRATGPGKRPHPHGQRRLLAQRRDGHQRPALRGAAPTLLFFRLTATTTD